MFGANAMWGLMSPISKFIMLGGAVTPLVVTDLRIGGAMVLFWIASFFQKPEHVSHKDLASLFVAALLGIVFNQGCFIFGVSLSSPGDASIITTSMPLWAMVLAALILKEPITGKKVLGICGRSERCVVTDTWKRAKRARNIGNNRRRHNDMGRFAGVAGAVLLCPLHRIV